MNKFSVYNQLKKNNLGKFTPQFESFWPWSHDSPWLKLRQYSIGSNFDQLYPNIRLRMALLGIFLQVKTKLNFRVPTEKVRALLLCQFWKLSFCWPYFFADCLHILVPLIEICLKYFWTKIPKSSHCRLTNLVNFRNYFLFQTPIQSRISDKSSFFSSSLIS